MGICRNLSKLISNNWDPLNRKKYGKQHNKFLKGSKTCTQKVFFTGILNVPISLKQKQFINLGTWMFPKLMEVNWPILKLGRHIMQAHKFGEMSLMTIRVIFGHLDALYMKWLHSILHLMAEICRICLIMYRKQRWNLYLEITAINFVILSKFAFKKTQINAHQQANSFKI